MSTINKLRQQNIALKASAQKAVQQKENSQRIYIIIIVLMLASILFLISKKSKVKV
jgi:hypothetical protein